jgi:transcription antitermination factor NusG
MGDEISRDERALRELAAAMRRGEAERLSHGRMSAVGEDDGLDVAPWFAVVSEPRGEWIAFEALRGAGLPVFLPHFAETREVGRGTARRRLVGVKVALFPGYLFARLRPGEVEGLRVLDGVADVVRSGGVARAVPLVVVRALIGACDANGCVQRAVVKTARAVMEFAIGELVRIGEGPFASFEAVVAEIDSSGRIGLDVDIFGRATRVNGAQADLDLKRVEPAKPRRRQLGRQR